MDALSDTEFTKTGELAKKLGCSNQTVTNTMLLLHAKGMAEMEWTAGGATGTRQWKKVRIPSAREIGKLEEIFQGIKEKCKYLEDDECTYRDNIMCNAEKCPMIIRRG